MYICKDCDRIFQYPRLWTETHGLDSPPFEKWRGCPYCGGVYQEAVVCELCGKYIVGKYIKTKDDQFVCQECYTEFSTDIL